MSVRKQQCEGEARSSSGEDRVRVLALSKYDRLGASSRHRFLSYFPFLAEQGISVTHAPLLTDAYVGGLFAGRKAPMTYVAQRFFKRVADLAAFRQFDVLWIEAELFPRMPGLVERTLQLLGRPYVVDLDDAIFHTYDLHPQPLVRQLLGRKIDRVLGAAAAVLAGNEYLAKRATQAGANPVIVMPTSVYVGDYACADYRDSGPLRFCWIGSPETEHYLEAIDGELKSLLKETQGELHLIGAKPDSAASPNVVVRPWREATEAAEIAACDIGIAPLADGPWERGKCGLKAIQYMAAGLPVIAANVGSLTQIVDHGETGFLYGNSAEFTEFALELTRDSGLRRRMGEAGRRKVAAQYSVERWASVVAEILKSAAQTRRRG